MKEKAKKNNSSLGAPIGLKFLFVIVDRTKADFYLKILEGYEANMQLLFYGHGTAPTEIAHYLGLVSRDKAILLNVVKENKVKEILSLLEDKYFKLKDCRGIAFSVPVSSMIGVNLYKFLTYQEGGKE